MNAKSITMMNAVLSSAMMTTLPRDAACDAARWLEWPASRKHAAARVYFDGGPFHTKTVLGQLKGEAIKC